MWSGIIRGNVYGFYFKFYRTSILGLIGYAIMAAVVKAPGVDLQQKFSSLGVVKGKTYAEIVNVVGTPSAQSAMGNGIRLYQWQATGYHIALLFDSDDICLGISSEISV